MVISSNFGTKNSNIIDWSNKKVALVNFKDQRVMDELAMYIIDNGGTFTFEIHTSDLVVTPRYPNPEYIQLYRELGERPGPPFIVMKTAEYLMATKRMEGMRFGKQTSRSGSASADQWLMARTKEDLLAEKLPPKRLDGKTKLRSKLYSSILPYQDAGKSIATATGRTAQLDKSKFAGDLIDLFKRTRQRAEAGEEEEDQEVPVDIKRPKTRLGAAKAGFLWPSQQDMKRNKIPDFWKEKLGMKEKKKR